MALRFGIILLASVLFFAHALFAEDAPPVPNASPPRVPFSAFRMKPILDLHHLSDGENKTAPDAAPVKTVPKAVVLQGKSIVKPATKPATAQAPAKETAPAPAPAVEIAAPKDMPVPEAKPRLLVKQMEDKPNVLERIFGADEDQNARPRPPSVAAQDIPDPNAAYIPPQKPKEKLTNSTVRIRAHDRSRFSSQSRMAGSDLGTSVRIRSTTMAGAGASLTKLGQAQGVSPVLLPGNTLTVAAPDRQDFDKRGVPSEVIVFFQENSQQLEVGQMDIIQTDVLNVLKNRPELALEIVGYAEAQKGSVGSADGMAHARAQMIRNYLVGKNISSDRLTVTSKGDDTKVDPKDRVDMFFSR